MGWVLTFGRGLQGESSAISGKPVEAKFFFFASLTNFIQTSKHQLWLSDSVVPDIFTTVLLLWIYFRCQCTVWVQLADWDDEPYFTVTWKTWRWSWNSLRCFFEVFRSLKGNARRDFSTFSFQSGNALLLDCCLCMCVCEGDFNPQLAIWLLTARSAWFRLTHLYTIWQKSECTDLIYILSTQITNLLFLCWHLTVCMCLCLPVRVCVWMCLCNSQLNGAVIFNPSAAEADVSISIGWLCVCVCLYLQMCACVFIL